jgi:hypothetical protein
MRGETWTINLQADASEGKEMTPVEKFMFWSDWITGGEQ